MCLEEMADYGNSDRRSLLWRTTNGTNVEFDTSLREETKNAARRLHVLVKAE